MVEIWKDIPGYDGLYQASTFGRIRSVDHISNTTYKRYGTQSKKIIKGKVLSLKLYKSSPYYKVQLIKNKVGTWYRVATLIYITFNGPIEPGLCIDHIDGNKTNNHLENLRAVTHKQNVNNPNTIGKLHNRYNSEQEHINKSIAQNKRFNGYTYLSKEEIGQKLRDLRLERKFFIKVH